MSKFEIAGVSYRRAQNVLVYMCIIHDSFLLRVEISSWPGSGLDVATLGRV